MTVKGALPTGTTRVAAVIGSPVRHSLSPAILNAAFQAAAVDWVYTAFAVPDGAAERAVTAMRTLGLGGLSVTMPHKAAVCAAVDLRSEVAEKLGAVNCVAWQGSQIIGHSTDGPGFLDALQVDEAWDPAGQRCVVLGAGGAARAVIVALADAGAAEVVVVNRTIDRAHAAVAIAGERVRVGTADEVADAALVVNATPIGMSGFASVMPLHRSDDAAVAGRVVLPFDPARLGPGQLVVDLIYDPPMTPGMTAATARGATAINGLGMLIHQAAHAFRLWTGEDPPLEAMSAAAAAELSRRQH